MPPRSTVLWLLLLVALVPGCKPAPQLMPARPEKLFQGLLAFLVDGKSRRDEVLLRLGPPMAQFEGERILTYAFREDERGEWQRVVRSTFSDGRHLYPPGTSSLVLVFGPDGVLLRHSLVVAR